MSLILLLPVVAGSHPPRAVSTFHNSVWQSPETILVKGDSVYMCADCGQKFVQPPPKKNP